MEPHLEPHGVLISKSPNFGALIICFSLYYICKTCMKKPFINTICITYFKEPQLWSPIQNPMGFLFPRAPTLGLLLYVSFYICKTCMKKPFINTICITYFKEPQLWSHIQNPMGFLFPRAPTLGFLLYVSVYIIYVKHV